MFGETDYERLYRDVIPSVVSLYVGRRAPSVGAGSGFVYDDQHVLTNQHVVDGAAAVELRFADGGWATGEVVGTDAYTDLAVVAVEDLPESATPLPVAGENPSPGRPVAALGNPLGLDGSITAGIVSGSNRSMPTSGGFAIPDVVQTDAPINPGNSGGPLVALDGDGGYEVVGVNRARQGDNIGFAVSPTIVERVVPELVESGRYAHSYLRARTLDVTPTVAEANGADEPRGVLVVDIAEQSSAGRRGQSDDIAEQSSAGRRGRPDDIAERSSTDGRTQSDETESDALRGADDTRDVRGQRVPVGGDIIVGIGGNELRSHEELMRYLITETRPGEPVEIDVIRDGVERTLSVTLDERPSPEDRRRERRAREGGRGGARRGSNVPVR
ncbi:S1C family serine protease [Halopelagius fulvigenes]|uniref:S1C family serine protease n=1 Tax=Halopelagius fulvigenes TaxID=1198324 RepID=A0ABD5U5R1_9EURY